MGRVSVKNLGKAYKSYPTRWSRLQEWLSPFAAVRHRRNWILRRINFSVEPGEAVGIIGVNGAGKSTLLKLITGTTKPTEGEVVISGRVSAMLELGMGFHPEFTGRQNVFMAAQLMGFLPEEIQALQPEIEAFAEIGDYLDQPVRVYSSGMQMRLAFSVATARRPDVLIVDEALSVGDVYFQHKSFDRIRRFREQGTTLLLVSHDKGAIQSLCDRAILLNAGRIAKEGDPETVMDYYNAMLAAHQEQEIRQIQREDGRIQTISGSGEAVIKDIRLLNQQNEPIEVVNVGQQVRLKIEVEARTGLPELVLGYMIKDRLGQPIFGTNSSHLKGKLNDVAAGTVITFIFSFTANLGPGNYSVAVALHTAETHLGKNYEWKDLAATFNVINFDRESFVGSAWLPPTMEYF
ncbi:MAG TPA: ABC transporter ATP-binding protein [Proteobacteria bacterium]|nr:ABC transporter ATP-binding protein [Pseudomonadota bacterium]